jgi:hypothetical protein
VFEPDLIDLATPPNRPSFEADVAPLQVPDPRHPVTGFVRQRQSHVEQRSYILGDGQHRAVLRIT